MYAGQARFLLPVALALFIPLGLVDAASDHMQELEADELTAGQFVELALAVGLQTASSTLGEVLYAGIAMAAVTESMEGRPRPPLGRVLRGLPYGPLVAVDVLFSLGLGIGIALLIVPGMVFFGRYILAAPLLEIERRGVRAAFRRSRSISRGHEVSLLVLLGGLWLATDALTNLLQAGGVWSLGDTFVTDWLIAVVISLAVTPVWAVAACVVAWRLLQTVQAAEPAAAVRACQPPRDAGARGVSPRPRHTQQCRTSCGGEIEARWT